MTRRTPSFTRRQAANLPDTPPQALQIRQLSVVYDRSAQAIRGVSLEVAPGQMVALLGANGAGKTSVLRAIAGFLAAERAEVTEGAICLGTRDLRGKSPSWIARNGVAFVPERRKIFDTLSVRENLEVGLSRQQAKRPHAHEELVYQYFPALEALSSRRAGFLSGGERQMLAIGRALMCQPQLLMIDELSLGLAPSVVTSLMRTLRRIREEQGASILFVEQNAGAALEVADHVYVLENGRVAMAGDPNQLMDVSEFRDVYLGMADEGTRSYAALIKSSRAGSREVG